MKKNLLFWTFTFCSVSMSMMGTSPILANSTTRESMGITQQNKVSKGIVTDENGDPIVGATIQVKGTTMGTVTNADGKFILQNIPADAKLLVISYIGMQSVETPVKPQLKITLKTTAQELDDIVVVAYGTAKKQSLVGAQTSVTAKEIAKRPVTNITTALSGVAPGVRTFTENGQPGSGSSIIIRGLGSMNASNSALIVVDGAQYTGALSSINPADIESINILKDAASTALYGSSGGNGVVLITTKSGARMAKGKPKIDISIRQGFIRKGQPNYDMLSIEEWFPVRWQQWYNQQVQNGDSPEEASMIANKTMMDNYVYNPFIGIDDYYVSENGKIDIQKGAKDGVLALVMPDGTLNPNIKGLKWCDDLGWEDELFRTGYRQEYIVSGGANTGNIKTYLSLNYLKEDGYRIATDFERIAGRASVTYDYNKYISLGTNINYAHRKTSSPRGSGSGGSNPFNFVRAIAPFYPIHEHNLETGEYILENGERIYDYSMLRPFNPKYNPLQEALRDLSQTETDQVMTRTFAEINLMKGLKFRTDLSYDVRRSDYTERYADKYGDQPKGLLTKGSSKGRTIDFTQLLTYNKMFGEHNFNVLLGHNSFYNKTGSLSAKKKDVGINGLDEFSNYTTMYSMSSGSGTYTKEGYFTRINYDYGNRYNASFSYRRDGTSKLDPDKRWGNFWAFGLGWNVTQEDFFNVDWINNLKVRASIGQTGNDGISDLYTYLTLYSLGNNNDSNMGIRFSQLGNKELIWETQVNYDLAVEFAMFRNRLNGTIELFNKESKDLIFNYKLPTSTGIGSMDKNIGKVRNYGLELTLQGSVIRTRDLDWRLNLNATYYKDKIVSLPEEDRENGIDKGSRYWREGRSRFEWYLNEYIGVNPETGNAIYRIDDVEYPEEADPNSTKFAGLAKEGEAATWTEDGRIAKRHYCGMARPKIVGGFGTSLSYKGFTLSTIFSYQLGGKAYDGAYKSLMALDTSGGKSGHRDLLKSFNKNNPNSNIPMINASSSSKYNNYSSDRFLVSSDALMLKSITLGYNLSEKFMKKVKVFKNANFTISAENLFLISARKGLNPMSGYTSSSSSVADYTYSKNVTMSINLGF